MGLRGTQLTDSIIYTLVTKSVKIGPKIRVEVHKAHP
jgi:hypothetical protein